MIFIILYYLVIFSIFIAGLFFIIGSIKNLTLLVDVKDDYQNMYPYTILKKMGPNAIKVFHIIIGFVFCIIAIALLAR